MPYTNLQWGLRGKFYVLRRRNPGTDFYRTENSLQKQLVTADSFSVHYLEEPTSLEAQFALQDATLSQNVHLIYRFTAPGRQARINCG